MYRTTYNTLNHYNQQKPGTVQGPRVPPPKLDFMRVQTPLYPRLNPNPKYNSLVYNGTGTAYYTVNEGPYGALNKNQCSENLSRMCTGGHFILPNTQE